MKNKKRFSSYPISLYRISLFPVFLLSLFPYALIAQDRVSVPTSDLNPPPVVYGAPQTQLFGELPVESFEGEDFPPEGWKKVTNFGGSGWQRAEVGSQVTGFSQAAVVDAPAGGDTVVALVSWATGDADKDLTTGQQTDQWLITPQITDVQPEDELTIYLKYFDEFADTLDILISTADDTIPDFTTVVDVLSFVGPEANNDWTRYSYTLSDFVAPGSDIFIAFRQHVANTTTEGDAFFLDLVEVAALVTNISDDTPNPSGFELHQNYPNPFNPSTNITFSLSEVATVSLRVYDLLGNLVTVLIDEENFPAGAHRVQFNAVDLPNGPYYYRLQAGKLIQTRKMLLLK